MLNSLRNRLFASYLLVLTIALVLVAFVTITTLSQRQTPPEFIWNELELLLRGFSSQESIRNFIQRDEQSSTINDTFDDFAERNSVRVMLVRQDNNSVAVIYDSEDEYSGQDLPGFRPVPRPPQRENNRDNDRNDNRSIQFGRFVEVDDTEWYFAGFSLAPNQGQGQGQGRPRGGGVTLLIAEPSSTESVSSAIQNFNDFLLEPLLRSAIIGGIIAFILAIFLTRSITRPLLALAKSAQYVAKGQFTEEVPETGPSEIKQVAGAFNRMTGEVLSAQQSQREFMANVSHDLKTPLTSIHGYSQAIMDGATKDPSKAAKIIHEEAERLTRMVDELTDLARLQAGRLSMKLTPLDVNDIVTAIAERLSLSAEKKNIELEVQSVPLPAIAADGDRLVQVLTNLIGNAIKYTPAEGKILVETGVRNGGVEIIVRDNGIGIPSDDLTHIFDRFYQVDKSRGPKRGTGLGLAITQEIVQSHGGTIHINSAGVNQGTSVTVWLPDPNLSTIVMRRVNVD